MNPAPAAGGWFDPALLVNCDLYLHWAIETLYAHVPAYRDTGASVGLLVEWKSNEAAREAANVALSLGLQVPRVYLGDDAAGSERRHAIASLDSTSRPPRRIWSLTVKAAGLEEFLRSAGPLASRIELAMPMAESAMTIKNSKSRQSATKVLAAVLDDGCAFANERFRDGTGTRILWLWNQDPKARGAPLSGANGPSPEANFGYGGQYSKGDLDDCYVAVGTQDQVYQFTGLTNMRRRATHGAHVTDLLANTEAPWQAGDAPWEIVFVQFPRFGVEDPSGIWLKRHAIDGLNYVVECAGPKTDTVVANISWGPQTGPHDGQSVLETGIAELIQAQASLPTPRRLIVTLPSGNSFGSQAHARIDYANGGRFDWHVPPDGELPAFIDLWWPLGVAPTAVRLRITAPGAAPVTVVPGKNPSPEKTWWARLKQFGSYAHVLVVVHPTCGPDASGRKAGPHGRWRFQIDPSPSGVDGDVHVYVARADHNMGARRRATASYLCDAPLLQARFRAPQRRDSDVLDSAIRRTGTLNGMATAAPTYTASGYVLRGFANARYSSAGPTRNGASLKPDFSCLTDRSPVRLGLRATGSRTGSTVVLIGTSTAAPQLGRKLAFGTPTVDVNPSPPCPERVGAGCLKAQPWLLGRS